MVSVLACLAAYGVALVACYRRWRTPGVIVLAILLAVADVAYGKWDVSRRHDALHSALPNTWGCHSLGLLPVLPVFTPAALVALWLVRRNTRAGTAPAIWTQLGGVLVAFAVAAGPALAALFEWGIMIWGCDTL